ncbi:TPA: RHS repeat protein [Salmonella enterica subsp. houtenae]|nr:RHS repeat protein [Salmonella enterica subsp. houtenae]
MSLNYYTQTPNFISASSDDIDPRTRLFSFNHSLTTLVGNYDMGPSLDLTLTYSPTTTDNVWGMGTGVMFTLTWYDKNARTLYLNSGETYKIDESTDGSGTVYFNVLQCKIKTFNAEKIDSGTGDIWYRITDNDGNVTELYEQDTGYFLPVTLWSPLGRSMTVSWTRDPGTGHLYLSKVTDETTDPATQLPRVLFSAIYSSGLVMTLLPGTDSEQTVTLNTSGGYLRSMTNSALVDSATPPVPVPWTFTYCNDAEIGSSGLRPLVSITMPTGLVKTAVYDMEAMAFPDDPNAPAYCLPAVTSLTISPGLGSPDIVTLWSFETSEQQSNDTPSKNYLGYGGNTAGAAWSADADASYSIQEPGYIYQSVSRLLTADGTDNAQVTIYYYNNYHLLTSTVTTQDGVNVYTVETDWYADTTKTYDQQPPNFQCPKLQTETWSSPSGSHSRYTGYEYDNYGNQTQQVTLADSNGQVTSNSTLTEYKFYSPAGEADSDDKTTGCPADPYGFVYRPKVTKVTPPAVNGYSDVPVRTTRYRYASMGTLAGACYSTVVMPVQDTYYGSDVPTDTHTLLSRVNEYETDNTSPHYGRQIKQTTNVYDPEYDPATPGSIEYYTQTLDTKWSLDQDANELTQEDTLTSHDALSVVASSTSSYLTGKPQSVTDILGNTTILFYDSLGRLKQKTRVPGTDYETSHFHDYTLEGHTDTQTGKYVVDAIITTRRDNAGNKTMIYHDGMGRPVAHKDNASDISLPDEFYQTGATGWDEWGRRLSHTQQDWTQSFYTDPDDASYKPDTDRPDVNLVHQAQFDVWGQQNLSIPFSMGIPLGMQYASDQDPVTLTTVTELQVPDNTLLLGRHKTQQDETLMTETLTTESKQKTPGDDSSRAVYTTSVNEYDGLGRLRKTTYPQPNIWDVLPSDTDTNGWVSTSYTYDAFDRVSSTTQWDVSDKAGTTRPASVAIQSWAYAPFTYAHLPVTVSIRKTKNAPDVVMGTQTFDGLGRMTGSVCGGREQTATYSGANMVPDNTKDANGNTLNYRYIPELNNALTKMYNDTNSLSQTIDYYKKPTTSGVADNTGRLSSATETSSRSNTYTWLPSGQSSIQDFLSPSGADRFAGNTWSLLGRPVTQTDVAGNTLILEYFTDGRLQTLTDPMVTVTLGYDTAGRLQTQTVAQNAHFGSDVLTTTLTLDDYGREIQRDITPNTGETLTIVTAYTLGGQVHNRTTTQGSTTLRDETFTYDVRNRMTDYVCTGSAPTQDAYGNAVSELHFTLDVYSNITHCQTILADNGGTDEADYYYTNPDDPCQLMSVTHTLNGHYPASFTLVYDDNGRMTTDEAGRTLSYDDAGRLISVTGPEGDSQYAYDAFDTLVTQSLSGDTRELYYAGNRLLSEVHVEQNQITRNIPGSWGTSAVSDESL